MICAKALFGALEAVHFDAFYRDLGASSSLHRADAEGK